MVSKHLKNSQVSIRDPWGDWNKPLTDPIDFSRTSHSGQTSKSSTWMWWLHPVCSYSI